MTREPAELEVEVEDVPHRAQQVQPCMRDRFAQLIDAGLWNTRRNAIRADLEALA